MKYKGYLVENIDNSFIGSVKDLDYPELESNKVIIKVHYSSLNYKDALASTGVKGVVINYPFTPGIDVAGEVVESASDHFSRGDKVIATGYKIGMSVFGGFGEIVQLPEDWIINLPNKLTLKKAMSYGTAGLTAAACIKKIVDSKYLNDLPIIVSGATGGVGSISAGILSQLGYEVTAISGKCENIDFFKNLGVSNIVSRNDFLSEPLKPLDKAKFSGAVDTVGGEILSKIISMIANNGVISCCGNVAGANFNSSVFPFILRGIQLSGIDSAESPLELKKELWNLLSDEWSIDLESQTTEIKIKDIDNEIKKILNGNQLGRIIIKHGDLK